MKCILNYVFTVERLKRTTNPNEPREYFVRDLCHKANNLIQYTMKRSFIIQVLNDHQIDFNVISGQIIAYSENISTMSLVKFKAWLGY